MRHLVRFSVGGRDYVVADGWRRDAVVDQPGSWPLGARRARDVLQASLRGAGRGHLLLQLSGLLGYGRSSEQLIEHTIAAIQARRLLLVELPRPTYQLSSRPHAEGVVEQLEALAREDIIEDSDWIEIRLTDTDGSPVGNIPYELELANGSIRRGWTDRDGRLRHDGVPAGNCRIEFPNIDASMWRPA